MSAPATACHDGEIPPFSYTLIPLPSPEGHIRLIELLPPDCGASPSSTPTSSFDSPLKARVSSAELNSSTAFKALSYVWGSPVMDRQLLLQPVNSLTDPSGELEGFTRFGITASLEEALRYIRHPTESITLWIDQICINQGDIPEKNAQVASMGKIFSLAETVLIWLGHATPNTREFLDRMEKAGALARKEGMEWILDAPKGKDSEQWGLLKKIFHPEDVNAQKNMDDPLDAFLLRASRVFFGRNGGAKQLITEEYRSWFSRTWFSRVWVLQEYTLARESVFVCGENTIDSQILTLADIVLYCFGSARRGSFLEMDSRQLGKDVQARFRWRDLQGTFDNALETSALESLFDIRRHSHHPRPVDNQDEATCFGYTFYQLTQKIYNRTMPPILSTDPRDRVYALLSLATDSEGWGIKPDYSESATVDNVFAKFTRAALQSSYSNMDLLGRSQFPKYIMGEEAGAGRLPSWVPDFWQTYDSISMSSLEEYGMDKLYSPTGVPHHTKARAHVLDTDDERVLRLRGIVVDSMTVTGAEWLGLFEGEDHINPLREYYSEVERMCNWSSWKAGQIYNGLDTSTPLRIMVGDAVMGPTVIPRRTCAADTGWMRELGVQVKTGVYQSGNVGKFGAMEPEVEAIPWEVLFQRLRPRLTFMARKRPFLTRDHGYVGMGPRSIKSGDVVVLLFGARTPYVLRPRPDCGTSYFEFLGEAYCHGIMDGEASGLPVVDIRLV